jgi:hypothetical protein
MEKKQALELIKQVIDAAVKRGLFDNIESTVAVNNAFTVIAQEITKENE